MKRIYSTIIISIVLGLVVLGWLLDRVFDATSQDSQQDDIAPYRVMADVIHWQLASLPEPLLNRHIDSLNSRYDLQFKLEHLENLVLPEPLIQQLKGEDGLVLESESGPYILRQLNEQGLVLHIDLPAKAPPETFLQIFLTLCLYAGISLIMVIWLYPLTRSLSQLSRAADRFGKGRLNVRVPTHKFSYIHTIESSFNRMAEQINELLIENKVLADSLLHDLRTPLACLRFGLEAAQGCRDRDKIQVYLGRMDAEVVRIESMLEEFLEYAKFENNRLNLAFTQQDITQIIAELNSDFLPVCNAKQLSLTNLCKQEALICSIDRHWMYRLLMNLLSNATKHAKHQIYIGCQVIGDKALITVEDDGPGIPEDMMEDIFKPFHTLEKSRNRQQAGFGLGLAVVKKIASMHNGQVSVTESSTLGGACFTLTLPVAHPELTNSHSL